MSAVAEALAGLARVLDRQQLRWFVFGAQAVAVRGAPRATQDLDVTVELERSRVRELCEALAGEGFRERYPESADALLKEAGVLPLRHPSGMEVDIVLAGSGFEALALGRATRLAFGSVEVPVAHATDLVVMKVLAGRGKDLEDVRSLLAGDEVDRDEARDLLARFERALGRSDLLPLLEAALAAVEGG